MAKKPALRVTDDPNIAEPTPAIAVPPSPGPEAATGTRYPELFAALTAPFDESVLIPRYDEEGRYEYYLPPAVVRERLNAVLGWENWWSDIFPSAHSCVCRLTIRLSDKRTITKTWAGPYTKISGNSYDDTLRFAAEMFGIGTNIGEPPVETGEEPAKEAPPAKPSSLEDVLKPGCFKQWVKAIVAKINREFSKKYPNTFLGSTGVLVDRNRLVSQLRERLAKERVVELDPRVTQIAEVEALLSPLFDIDPSLFNRVAKTIAKDHANLARAVRKGFGAGIDDSAA
jgi:hypothetical protein